jgi:pilus assembly protein CpaF
MTMLSHQRAASPPLDVDEDGGLASLLGTAHGQVTRTAILTDPAILQAVKEVLQASFEVEARRHYLNPFASPELRNAEVVQVLRQAIGQHRSRGGVLARVPNDDATLILLFACTLGWGPAQRYLDDVRVNEVKINGRVIQVQESGKPWIVVEEQFSTVDEVRDRTMLLASILGVRLDAEHPQETLPVADGTRMHVTIAPRIPRSHGALVCIRRGRRDAWDLNDVRTRGGLDDVLYDLLLLFARARCSFLIAGRTGSGKTALLEALANSWPNRPHIVTIEDQALEINIAGTDQWTREQVNTQRDPSDFGRVAKEALRQTPGLLLPGETRGNEAGAILAMVLSDHPVITTLHARTCAEAVERFASFAAMPGAYMYDSRRIDALRDTAAGFDVVIKMDVWEELGLRLITEVALLGGAIVEDGILRPVLVPLARVDVQDDGRITWQSEARVSAGGMLEWAGGTDQTPVALRDKLVRARALAQIRQTATTLDAVADAIGRANTHLLAGEAERALAVLSSAWSQRRDGRLLGAAQQAISQSPGRFALLVQDAAHQRAVLQQLVSARQWGAAREAFDTLMTDLARAALATPAGGWDVFEAAIRAGLARDADAEEARIEAEAALALGHPRQAVSLLARFALSELPHAVALPLVRVRERAMEQLVALGQGNADALTAVRAERQVLEAAARTAPKDT